MKITAKIIELMKRQDRVRNIAIAAHIDHGKTTFSDSLMAASGMLSRELAGKALALDFHDDERERGITIDAALANLVYSDGKTGDEYAISLLDTPGHVDFGADVTRAMRAVDGCVVLVCAVEGVMPQTETVLKQALREKVKPILFVNKVDRLIKELKLSPEQIQERLTEIIARLNELIQEYAPETGWKVSAADDSACFGSAAHQWGFSSSTMKSNEMSFGEIVSAYGTEQHEDGNNSAPAWKELSKKIPLSEAVFNAVVKHLPSPADAQKYRIPKIWPGDTSSGFGQGLAGCDAASESAFVITKIMTDPHAGQVCIGRVFSGTLKTGQRLHNNRNGQEETVTGIHVVWGQKKEAVAEVRAGNVVAVSGMRKCFAGDTLTEKQQVPFEQLHPFFEPVVSKTIEPKKPQDMDRLIEILVELKEEDPFMKVQVNRETGENIISGMGELQLEVIENRIRTERKLEVMTGNPIVTYRETVSRKSPLREVEAELESFAQAEDSGSPLFVFSAEPNVTNVKKGQGSGGEKGRRGSISLDNSLEFRADLSQFRNREQLKEAIEESFMQAMDAGVIAREPCIGIRISLENVSFSQDQAKDIHSIQPMIRNSIRVAMKHAFPALLEPVQSMRFELPPEFIGEITKLTASKKGEMTDMNQESQSRVVATIRMPVAEMMGLASDVRSVTEGKASFSIVEQSFEQVPEEIRERVMKEIRKRKGIWLE